MFQLFLNGSRIHDAGTMGRKLDRAKEILVNTVNSCINTTDKHFLITVSVCNDDDRLF